MKHLSTLLMTLVMVFVAAVPKAQAESAYNFSLAANYDWFTNYTNPGTDARQCTLGPNGQIYALSNTAQFASGVLGVYRIGQSGGALINSGMGSAGWGNAFDDSGNYVYHANYGTNRGGTQKYTSTATCFRHKVLTTDGALTGGAYIDATSINFGRVSWYIDATGNVASGTGYIWTVPSTADPNILALKIVNSAVTQKLSFNVNDVGIDMTGIGVDCQIQFYDTQNATSHKCMLHLRGKGIYDLTLNINTQKITSCKQITDANANSNSLGTHIFTFKDRKFVVRNTRRVGSTGGEKNLCTEFEILDITDSYTSPVSYGVRDPFPNASAGANTGSYIQTSVSGDVAKIYAYSMGNGVACYTFTATAKPTTPTTPVSNLSATVVEDNDPNYIGRQNTHLVWTANSDWSMQPTSYTVECRESYDLGSGLTTTSWSTVGTTTTLPTAANPYVHYDVRYVKSGLKNVPCTYEYRVTPIFSTGTGAASTTPGVTPKFIPIAPRWIYIFGEQAYPGLCMAQLYWEYPQYGLKPDSYDIYRNGESITGETHVAAFVKVDYDVDPNATHSYEITTYYNGLDNSEPARSSVKTVTIGSRDWSKPKYTISEVYNFDLDADHKEYEFEASAHASNFTSRDCYPQGTFKNGKWYIAQMYDDLVNRDLHNVYSSDYVEGNSWSTYIDECVAKGSVGSILVFDGDAQSQANGKMIGGKKLPIDLRVYQNRGIGVDDAGNIFVRGITKTSATKADYAYCHDFEYVMAKGLVYKANADGSYTPYDVDFSGAGIDFAEMSQDTGGPVEGRCDYYSMKGNVFSEQGAYLYVAPTQTKAVYVIKLKASGSTITVTKEGVYFEHGTNQNTQSGTLQPYKASIENFAFPVNCEGREGNQFIHNVRSNIFRNLKMDNSGTVQYNEELWVGTGSSKETLSNKPYSYNVSGVEGYAAATPTVNAEGRIYDFHSRVNNPGGSTFEFNGELFIVTPISQYSINTGSFYLGRGFRKTISVDPVTGVATRAEVKDADLCNIVPVGTVYQTDEATNANSNAAGVWLYGEVPDLAGEPEADKDGDGKADYAYIYVYAPGQRFAKYRLEPDGLFPPSPNEVVIAPEYEREYVDGEHNAGGELLKYDAIVSWQAIENTYNTDGTGNFSVDSYSITLCYEDGTPVLDENGNPLTQEVPVYNAVEGTSSEYVVLDAEGNVVNYTCTFPDVELYDAEGNVINYVSQVVVHYKGVDGSTAEGQKYTSVKTEDEGNNDYDVVAPGGTVDVGVAEDWADWDGDKQKSKDDGYWNRYTIELDPTNPEWGSDQRQEPISYYTIAVSSDDSETNDAANGNKQICDFYLYDPDGDASADGIQNVTGLTPDANGYVHITDCKIPGDYMFTPDDDTPDVYWSEIDYVGGTEGSAAELEDGKINPGEWTYTITAQYAAGNTKISKSASGDLEEGDGVVTGVEVIDTAISLSVYPVPATSAITVKSSEAINTIAIYSAAGVQVEEMDCDGENVVVVAIDNLAAGNYFLKVNNLKPVKIVKM